MENNQTLKTKNQHNRDKNILFIEQGHKYFVKNVEYDLSVTGFVHSFFPKFKADEIISKMMMSRSWPASKYYGMEPDEIKESWDENGRQSAELGTQLHLAIEQFYNDNPTPKNTTEYGYFKQFQIDHKQLKPFRTEWEIYDEELKLAGSIDMVFEDKQGNYHLYDWKRSKQIKENNSYEEGHYPLAHLPNANYWHYSLQLNIYKQILEKNYGIKIEDLYIVQFHPDQQEYNKIKCANLNDEVLDMFKERSEELFSKESKN
jgi:ATP-dependent exoDNAse (exonuclease V) beta subunit